MMTNSNLDPNYYNTLGYERAMSGQGLLLADTAGTNEECVAAYERGWLQGDDDYTAACDKAWQDESEHVDEIDDGDDYDWSDDDCEDDGYGCDSYDDCQYDDDPNPYSGT